MDKQAIIERLVIAYRDADFDFNAAQQGDPSKMAFALSRIIGKLQGDINVAARELGYDGQMRINP